MESKQHSEVWNILSLCRCAGFMDLFYSVLRKYPCQGGREYLNQNYANALCSVRSSSVIYATSSNRFPICSLCAVPRQLAKSVAKLQKIWLACRRATRPAARLAPGSCAGRTPVQNERGGHKMLSAGWPVKHQAEALRARSIACFMLIVCPSANASAYSSLPIRVTAASR